VLRHSEDKGEEVKAACACTPAAAGEHRPDSGACRRTRCREDEHQPEVMLSMSTRSPLQRIEAVETSSIPLAAVVGAAVGRAQVSAFTVPSRTMPSLEKFEYEVPSIEAPDDDESDKWEP
jgi:hypothetical protein